MIFLSSPKALQRPCFGQNVCAFFRFVKISRFFLVCAPALKLVYSGAKGAFRNFSGWVSQKWISQNSTKGDPLGRHGVESLWGKASAPPPPISDPPSPKSAPDQNCKSFFPYIDVNRLHLSFMLTDFA